VPDGTNQQSNFYIDVYLATLSNRSKVVHSYDVERGWSGAKELYQQNSNINYSIENLVRRKSQNILFVCYTHHAEGLVNTKVHGPKNRN
jgi:hypothetical protein